MKLQSFIVITTDQKHALSPNLEWIPLDPQASKDLAPRIPAEELGEALAFAPAQPGCQEFSIIPVYVKFFPGNTRGETSHLVVRREVVM